MLLVFWRFNAIRFTHERFLISTIKKIEYEREVFLLLLLVSFIKKEIQNYAKTLEGKLFFYHLSILAAMIFTAKLIWI